MSAEYVESEHWQYYGRKFIAPDDGGTFDLDNQDDAEELFAVVFNLTESDKWHDKQLADLRTALEAANQDAERLAEALTALHPQVDIAAWPVISACVEALRLHQERINPAPPHVSPAASLPASDASDTAASKS